MGRKAHFNKTEIIDAALQIIAEEGLKALTMQSIAEKIQAPIGSIYHRFHSRDELLAELWINIAKPFQEDFLATLNNNGLQAALFTLQWVRTYPKESHVLLLYRREELSSGDWPEDFKQKVADLSSQLDDGIHSFIKRFFGRVTKNNIQRTVFALIDVPFAAVKRSLQDDEVPTPLLDKLVRETYITIMGRDD